MLPSESFSTISLATADLVTSAVSIISLQILDCSLPTLIPSSFFDVVVFLVWVGVCLAPIFQELNLFGVKLKQQVNELKKDLNHQLSMMKVELQSSIEVSNANQNHISVNTAQEPPKDSDIPQLEKTIEKLLAQKGIVGETYHVPEVDDISVEMFKVRLAFERLISEYTYGNHVGLISRISYEATRKRTLSLGRMLSDLKKVSPISPDILDGVSEIISICNYAIHGEKLSETQVDFVRRSHSNLYKALDSEFREHYL